MATKVQAFPRSLSLAPADMVPDLAGAFKRWVEMDELPADAVLGEFIGRSTFRDVCTGRLFEAGEDWETIAFVSIKKDRRKSFMILRNPG